MLPEFLVVGAAKAGSTTIHDVLTQHEDIFLPPAKELHYFDDDFRYQQGPDWYEAQFGAAHPAQLVGEITPAYMAYRTSPQRILATLGSDVKLIFSLREPVARAYSEFMHNKRRGYISGEFASAITWEFQASQATQWERRKYSFISRGFYASQISHFLKTFSRENMFFVVIEEDFGENIRDTFSRIQDFLGIKRIDLDLSRRSNQAFEPRSLPIQRILHGDNSIKRCLRLFVSSRNLRQRLRNGLKKLNMSKMSKDSLTSDEIYQFQQTYFVNEIDALENIISRDLSVWRATSPGKQM